MFAEASMFDANRRYYDENDSGKHQSVTINQSEVLWQEKEVRSFRHVCSLGFLFYSVHYYLK
jgi:hypothetical protein